MSVIVLFSPAGSAAAVPSNCVSDSNSVRCTFTYTGSEQRFVVPAWVSSLDVTVVGAAGGRGEYGGNSASPDSLGGVGASLSATLTGLTGGASLFVEVGGVGSNSVSASVAPGNGSGGWNGGGNACTICRAGNGSGGGGGGGSDIRTVSATQPSTLESRLAVAGGGGGGGAYFCGPPAVADGGDAGPIPLAGADAFACRPSGSTGGQPGGPSAGGAAGTTDSSNPASAGGRGVGGDSFSTLHQSVGGGGGGGNFGGGGGGGLSESAPFLLSGGSGGGAGSSWAAQPFRVAAASGPAEVVLGYAKQAQTITVTAPGPQTAGTSGTVAPTAPGGPVTVSSSALSVCTISGTTVEYRTAGRCILHFTQPGSDRYAPTSSNLTITVTAATPMETVSFDTDGGSTPPPSQTVAFGSTAAAPSEPARSGYTFEGWSTTADGSSGRYDFSRPVTASFTLYAQWTAVTVTISGQQLGATGMATGTLVGWAVPLLLVGTLTTAAAGRRRPRRQR